MIDSPKCSLNWSPKTPPAKQHSAIATLLALLATCLLLSCCQSKETVLLSGLNTKNDRILYRILQETNFLLKSSKKLKDNTFDCFSIIKNDLLRNKVSTYQPLNYSINTFESIILQQVYSLEPGSPQQTLYYRLDRILDILSSKCVYFRTITFITEYCHKLHIRQYDDDHTKMYNQKPNYEDFNLGVFSA